MNHLNKIDPNHLQVITTNETSNLFYQIYGNEMSWHQVQPVTGLTFYDDPNSHDYTNLGIYSNSDIQKYNITYSNGGLKETMIEKIYEAYNTTGLFVCSLDKTTFRASLAPNMRIKIPITGGTGTLSGLSSTELYTGFINQNDSLTPNGSGPCPVYTVDTLLSETYVPATYGAGIGYDGDGTSSPSGFMYLFSKDIYLSGNTGTTFDVGWSGNSRYTFCGSELVTFNGPERNVAVGIVKIDTGVITLFDPNIVASFNTSVATGGTTTSGLTFSTNDSTAWIRDIDESTALEITTILGAQEYTESLNKSRLDAEKQGIDCKGQVSVTRMCFYGPNGQLTATAGLSDALVKRNQDNVVISNTLTLDGGIQLSVYESELTRPTFTPGIC
jgi:hypothetical protein